MHPTCKECGSQTTRRTRRRTTFLHRLRHFFGYYPWECMDCQARFFCQQRYPRGKRSEHGEVYIGDKRRSAPDAKPAHNDPK